MESSENKLKSMTISGLAEIYGVSTKTMVAWIRRAGIAIDRKGRGGRTLPPSKVREIRSKLD